MFAAEAVAEQAPARPHPGIRAAVGWTSLLAAAQIAFSLIVVIPVVIFYVVQGKTQAELQALLDSQINAILLPGATLTTCVVAWGIARRMLGRDYLRLVGWRGFAPLHLVWVLLLVLPLGIVAGEVAAWADEVLPSLLGENMADMAKLPLALIFVGGCLLPAVGEELFFRGFLSRGLMGKHGLWIGAGVASLLFGLLHIDPVQICGTLVLGLGFQYVFITTRSLPLPMVGHLLNNMLAFGVISLSDEPDGLESTAVDHYPLIVVLAALFALGSLLALLYQTRIHWTLPGGGRWSPPYPSCEAPPPSLGASAAVARPNLQLVLWLLGSYAGLIAALATSQM